MRIRGFIFLAILSFLSIEVVAQMDTIRLVNPSFEGKRQGGIQPRGWADCGVGPDESPPDTQPGAFDVTTEPVDGNSYLGLVVRANDTWEAVGQELSSPLKAGQCYEFSVYLARSRLYLSGTRMSRDLENHITPAKFKIYGGFDYCDRQEVLAETREIVNFRWLKYTFKLEPTADYSYIVFEAFYQTPVLFPYNGNLLIDNASEIVITPCEVIAQEETKEETKGDSVVTEKIVADTPVVPEEVEPEVVVPDVAPVTETVIQEEIDMKDISSEDLEAGQIFRIEDIQFDTNSYTITGASSAALDDLYLFLKKNPGVVIEIGGHTNGRAHQLYAKKLSTERAEAVVNYLKSRGITSNRLYHKGYGKSKPIDTNSTEAGRKRNQRVEVKILKN